MCHLNIPQAAFAYELNKTQHKELIAAIKLDGMPIAFVAAHTLRSHLFFFDSENSYRQISAS